MNREQAIEKIAQELFFVWVEAKSSLPDGDNWNDQTWETLPEKHKEEYLKTATRIWGYRPIPELKILSDEELGYAVLAVAVTDQWCFRGDTLEDNLPSYLAIALAQCDKDKRQINE